MKKFLSILISIVLLFLLCACEGNFSQVDLQSDIAIPEDGIIEKSVLNHIKDENAIATFTGKSGDYSYEWTVFVYNDKGGSSGGSSDVFPMTT